MTERHTIRNDILLAEIRARLLEGKRVKLRAKGESMHPFIKNGDTLIIVPAIDLYKGDVLLAHIEGRGYVVHRMVEITPERVVLMGDGNLFGKEICCRKDIYGKVVSITRDGREKNLLTRCARLKASGWRLLLPVRRLGYRISRLIHLI